jgi:PKD repeat protein
VSVRLRSHSISSLMKNPKSLFALGTLALAFVIAWADDPAPASSAELFTQFTANPDNHNYLPDNSYAGYRRGEVALPIVAQAVNAATEFGAVGDGTTENSEALRQAIDAAYARGGGAVFLPAGTYAFDRVLRMRRAGVVLRGAGQGQTILKFRNSLTTQFGANGATSKWNWAGGSVWFAPDTHFYLDNAGALKYRSATPDGYGGYGAGAGQSWEYFFAGPERATVTSTQARGDRTLTVSNVSRLSVGQMILLTWDVTAGQEFLKEIAQHESLQTADFGSWLTPAAGYPRYQWPVEIKAINGNQITLAQPLRVSIQAVHNCRIFDIGRTVNESGVEDLTIDLTSRPDVALSHNAGAGWNGIYATKAYNCWVKNVSVVDGEGGMIAAGTKGLTFQNVHVTGSKMMHHPYATRCESADVLYDGFEINLTGTQMNSTHGINTEWLSSGNVWTRGDMKQGTFDTHSGLAFDFIRTDINVANNKESSPGGAAQAGVYAGRRVAHWNVRVVGSDRPDVLGVDQTGKFINHPLQFTTSAIVGIQGVAGAGGSPLSPATLNQSAPFHMPNVAKDVVVFDYNTVPLVPNLYDAQLAARGDREGWAQLAYPNTELAVAQAGVVTLKAGARAKGGRTIDHVDFLANGNVVGTATSAPWNVAWSVAPGLYQMKVRVVDNTSEIIESIQTSLTVGTRRRIEDTNTELLFIGANSTLANAAYSGGSARRFTSSASSTVVFQFKGTRARFLTGSAGVGSITFEAYVDDLGTPVYNSGYLRESELDHFTWDTGPLPDGVHTIMLTKAGEQLPFDAMDVDETGAVTNYPPLARIGATSFIGNAPFNLSLNSTGSLDRDGTIASYAWDLNNDGTTDATTPTASTTFTTAGTYIVKLTLTDNAGATSTSTKQVSVTAAAPTASFTATPASGDQPLNVALDAAASVVNAAGATIVNYEWDFTNDNIYDAVGVTANFVYTQAGTFTAKLLITDSNGTQATATKVITVLPNLAPVASAGPPQGILTATFPATVNLSGSFTDDGKPSGASYASQWSQLSGPVGATVIFPDPTLLITTAEFPAPGIYTLRLTVSDSDLSGTHDVQIAVSLASNTAPTISDVANQTIFNNANTGALTFTVNDAETPVADLQVSGVSSNAAIVPNANIVFGGSGASRTVTVTPAAGQSGTVTITLVVNDGSRLASDTFTLTINAAPVATAIVVTPTPTNVALGGTQTFTAVMRDQYGNPLSPQPSFTWSTTGGGTISAGGLYTAGTTPGGPYIVSAVAGSITGTAQITVGNVNPAPGNTTIVNWFGNYANSSPGVNSTQTLNDTDLNGDGNAWDAYRRIPFSTTTPLNPTATSYIIAAPSARFYGGVNLRSFGTSATTKAGIPAFSDTFIVNNGGSTSSSTATTPTDDAMGFRFQPGLDLAWSFAAVWLKPEFLGTGSTNNVSFGNGSLLQVSVGDSGGNGTLRWDIVGNGRFLVRNGTQWYVSQAALASNTSDKLLSFTTDTADGNWAPVDPAAAVNLNLDLTAVVYAPQNFDDLTGVGFYLENDLATGAARAWWYVDQFRVDAVAASPLTPYQQFQASAFPTGTPVEHTAPAFDFDMDGLNNLLEYGLGLNPAVSSAMPAGQLVTDAGQQFLQLQFTRPTGRTDIATNGEVSSDLGSTLPWDDTAARSTVTISPAGANQETVTVRLLPALGTNPRDFLRVRIRQLP